MFESTSDRIGSGGCATAAAQRQLLTPRTFEHKAQQHPRVPLDGCARAFQTIKRPLAEGAECAACSGLGELGAGCGSLKMEDELKFSG
eukprot:3720309-Pleurochrysis_carterae.AAC.2